MSGHIAVEGEGCPAMHRQKLQFFGQRERFFFDAAKHIEQVVVQIVINVQPALLRLQT